MGSPDVLVEEVSTITAKGQTTVPKPIRQALGVEAGDQIAFQLGQDGSITLRRAEAEADPVMASFLSFLARDLERHPDRIAAVPRDLIRRIDALVKHVEADPDDPVEGD